MPGRAGDIRRNQGLRRTHPRQGGKPPHVLRAAAHCRQGFMVSSAWEPDLLDPAKIIEETPAIAWGRLQVMLFDEIESTNETALQCARRGAAGGTLVVAEYQTRGRGRMGRHWISPRGAGLYFSLILRPEPATNAWPLLTHVAACALADALRALPELGLIPHALDVELKWPNDVLVAGRKVEGILLETTGAGAGKSAAILGVGVNINRLDLPADLAGKVTSLGEASGVSVPRRPLLVSFLRHFQRGYELFRHGDHTSILDRWKAYSRMWKDTPVWIVEEGRHRAAVTRGLSPGGALIVETPDGREETILAGDVSVRRPGRE
jgi:BirA family transcriptional regulator, biotin operon repressor / biotin---[acetyl-CoA-carboxylase] ligase